MQMARKTVIPESEDWNCGFGSFITVQIQARTINPLGLFFQLSGEAMQSPVKDEDEGSGVSLPESKFQPSDTELVNHAGPQKSSLAICGENSTHFRELNDIMHVMLTQSLAHSKCSVNAGS